MHTFTISAEKYIAYVMPLEFLAFALVLYVVVMWAIRDDTEWRLKFVMFVCFGFVVISCVSGLIWR